MGRLGIEVPERDPWEGLPRRAPEELDALARAQGVPLAARVDDLIGDFWPEEETCDEFIAAVREWRREESGLQCCIGEKSPPG
jgi:hypothetical protein